MSSERRKFWFIVNPTAGRNRVHRFTDSLRSLLERSNIDFELEITEGPGHATLLARKYSTNGDIIVAVGGDGTVHEVANGLIGSMSILGVIPFGSGNDFARVLRAPKTLEEITDYLILGTIVEIDTGRVTFKGDQVEGEQSFVNGIGIGFDAEVSSYSKRVKWLTGLPLYVFSLLRTLPNYTAKSFNISVDGMDLSRDCFLVYVGNGPYEGGGFKVVPHADAQDGRLDVCLIRPVSVSRVLSLFPMVISGKHGNQKEVEFNSCMKVEIGSSSAFACHVDGEIVGTELHMVNVAVVPRSMRVLQGRSSVR